MRLAVLALLLIAACTEVEKDPIPGQMTEREKTACLKFGGKTGWSSGMFEPPEEYCVMPAADEGKSCRKESDCSVVCLAETKTCGTFYGAGEYSVMNDDGEVEVGMLE